MAEPPSVHDPKGGAASSFNGIKLDAIDVSAPPPSAGDPGSYTAILTPGYGRGGPSEELSPRDRWRHFEKLSRYAGLFTTLDLGAGRIQFVQEWPVDWEYSLLIRLETPPSHTVSSRYGLLDAVDHGPMAKKGAIEVEFDLVYLAPLSEYETKTELRQDLEAPGF